MKRLALLAITLTACSAGGPAEHYGFVTTIGRDTISVESVTRRGSKLISDEAEHFPMVRQRHTEITLDDDGTIRHLVMDIHTPSEPEKKRDRKVIADVTNDQVKISKTDETGTVKRTFDKGDATAVAHVPQMYSIYELYFTSAAARAKAMKLKPTDTVRMRQFYIDREFDNYPFHRANVRFLPNGKAEVWHDWLSGVGEATLDSGSRLLSYSGARTTYDVSVKRITDVLDVKAIGDRFAAAEAKQGGVKSLSVRDTTRQKIGNATFLVDYGRPLARGRVLLGNIIPYDRVWRTGANAATQFETSAPITLAGMPVAAGKYTLWTVPHASGVDLIVNKQTGQWGTSYNGSLNLSKAPMTSETVSPPVEKFTISIVASGDTQGKLVMEWGPFRWTAPIGVR